MLPREERAEIAVNHITGNLDYYGVRRRYEALNMEACVYPFFENMRDLYSEADMAIARAGANTLFELALYRIPAIIIPYPHAGDHQAANARVFADRGAVRMHEESTLCKEILWDTIQQLKNDPNLRRGLSEAISSFSPEGAEDRLCDLAGELIRCK